jgi:CRISPR-associated protein Csm1
VDSPAYVVYIADNISSAADRRDIEGDVSYGFEPGMPLDSVFNILNDNDGRMSYQPDTLEHKNGINFPRDSVKPYDTYFYGEISRGIRDGLKRMEHSAEYVNSALALLEGYLSFVPSSTDKKQLPDISLYDHSKTSAAIASCVYEYLSAKGATDFKTALFDDAERFYGEKCFLLYSCDMSGIQDFIYAVSGEKMLKSLRARSFYLEITLEDIVDEILDKTGLSRANLIYSGGGHAYILLPNTNGVRRLLDETERELNAWFMENFKTALYIASAYTECSGEDFMNKPPGNYSDMFKRVGEKLSSKKLARYDADAVASLNFGPSRRHDDGLRECKECRRSDTLTGEDICELCSALKEISPYLTESRGKDFFVITRGDGKYSLPLPYGKFLRLTDEDELRRILVGDGGGLVRFYRKNNMSSGDTLATNLWMGDYAQGGSFEDLAWSSEGIKRVAVLRADVDNLGRAFVSGFRHKRHGDKYVTLSRSAALSRQLSLFFKYHINYILRNPSFSMKGGASKKRGRNAIIVYSGGDDIFIVGAWDDCVELAVDIDEAFARYTRGSLSISAGIGLYDPRYPIARMAYETGRLEDLAKNLVSDGGSKPEKNKVALFAERDDRVFSWRIFKDHVLIQKLGAVRRFFDGGDERGKAMIYKLLEYLRGMDNKINVARLAYTLARLEPEAGGEAQKNAYAEFAREFYGWALDGDARKELETALELHIYLTRDAEREGEE